MVKGGTAFGIMATILVWVTDQWAGPAKMTSTFFILRKKNSRCQ